MKNSDGFIVDPRERMEKLKRRSASLMKAACELSTLCDTPACIVIFPPIGTSDLPFSEFAMWPNLDDSGAALRRMIDLHKAAAPQPNQINNSLLSNPKVKANKKIKVNNQTTGVSCGNGLGLESGPRIFPTASAAKNVLEEAGNEAMQVGRMDQIQTRVDSIDSRKRKRPDMDSASHYDAIINVENNNTDINTNVDAAVALNGKEKEGDLIDLSFFDFTEKEKAMIAGYADIDQGGAVIGPSMNNEQPANSVNIVNNEDTSCYDSLLEYEDWNFENIFGDQQMSFQDSYIYDIPCYDSHDAANWFTNPNTLLAPWESSALGLGW